jgi:hypothetical protein
VDSIPNADLRSCDGRADATASTEAHRFSTPAVHELTPQEIEKQRDLVLISLLPTRARRGVTMSGRPA